MSQTATETGERRISSPAARIVLLLFLAAFAVASIVLVARRWSGSEDLTTQSSLTAVPVDAVAVESVDSITTERFFTGRVAARRAGALAFERSARVEAVLVDEGDRVRQGQALARLDRRDLELRRSQLEASLSQAQARLDELVAGPRQETIAAARAQLREAGQQLELARVQTKRRQELLDRQAISREEFDRLDFQARSLQASSEAAQARLDELLAGVRPEQIRAQQGVVAELESRVAGVALDLDKSVLRAPFDGRINQRLLDEGAIAAPGQSVLTLLEDAQPEVRIGLPADAAAQIAIGDRRSIEVGGKSYPAVASGLLPELEAETRTATLIFALDAPASEPVFPGQIARLAVERDQATAGYWIPLEALSRGVRGLWACYVLVEAGESTAPEVRRLEQRQVEILSTEGDRALVRGTISAGDLVVRSGVNRVTAGQLVRARI
ncbi:MAG: biotin/lipoyl-binding protein [Acidobacteria bacterium]|nr:biotin/lipoyl-binding protein [Acidobacteriota bacterium]